MKRHVALYVGFSVAAAFCLAGGILSFVACAWGENVLYAGVIGMILAVVSLMMLFTVIGQDDLNIRCGKLCEARRYEEERALIERKMRSPLFFLIRSVALTRYVRVCMALDDLPTARRYIESLRHGGGAGWKYKTAFFSVLIALDGGDIEKARLEYEDFRTNCANAPLYREEIAVLSAIFHRIFGTNNEEPLPEAAVGSPFPVIGRVLGRAYEARADGTAWE